MKKWERKLQEMEHSLKLSREENEQRFKRFENELETVCRRVQGMEILSTEIRRKSRDLEMARNQLHEKVNIQCGDMVIEIPSILFYVVQKSIN